MAAPLSKKESERTKKAFEKAEGNKAAAAQALGISRSTLCDRLTKMGLTFSKTPSQVSQEDKQRVIDLVANLRSEVKRLTRDKNSAEDFRQSVFKLPKLDTSPPQWVSKISKEKSVPGVPMLFFSDAQFGEVIKKEDLDGINEFNVEIAKRRYTRMIDRTIELSFKHMVNPVYPGIIYLRGGDMISGDIHEELRETNELSSIPSVNELVRMEREGIKRLKAAFKKVWVVSVPGNHGRTTVKPHAKDNAARNYDYLSAVWLESLFAGDPDIKFWAPLSGDALFEVCGYTFLLTHGDKIGSSGGQGFVGPSATISRGMKKLIDYYAKLGRKPLLKPYSSSSRVWKWPIRT